MFDLKSRNEYAILCENTLDKMICERYGVKRNHFKYAIFDWQPDEQLRQVELKTRFNNNIEDYDELTANDIKINDAKNKPFESYFLYWFKNGDLYEWKYDPDVKLPRLTNGDKNLGENHIKERPHIPTKLLTKIGNFKLPDNNKQIVKGKCLLG